jgi:hypothetical protein
VASSLRHCPSAAERRVAIRLRWGRRSDLLVATPNYIYSVENHGGKRFEVLQEVDNGYGGSGILGLGNVDGGCADYARASWSANFNTLA